MKERFLFFTCGVLITSVFFLLVLDFFRFPVNFMDGLSKDLKVIYRLAFPWVESSRVIDLDDFIIVCPYGDDPDEILIMSRINKFPAISVTLDELSRTVKHISVSDVGLNMVSLLDTSLDGYLDNMKVSFSEPRDFLGAIDQDFDGHFDYRYKVVGEDRYSFEIYYMDDWKEVIIDGDRKYINTENGIRDVEITAEGFQLR